MESHLAVFALWSGMLVAASPSSRALHRGYASVVDGISYAPAPLAARDASAPAPTPPVGYFIRSLAAPLNGSDVRSTAGVGAPAWLAGVRHYRLLPGTFPSKMKYHFDGLATVSVFTFTPSVAGDPALSFRSTIFASDAAVDYKKCLFFGTGTGPTLGTKLCFQNPGVNLLPIGGELWLTIDTLSWGRVDPVTLETIDAKVDVPSFILNAHPACDRLDVAPSARECFVQHPCGNISKASGEPSPITDGVCFSLLVPGSSAVGAGSAGADMATVEVGRTTLAKSKILQHSHSPCITEHFVVSKLDSFTPRLTKLLEDGGLLRFVHQDADSLWAVSSFMYRYILRESCSQFDSLPLTSLTIFLTGPGPADERDARRARQLLLREQPLLELL